MKRLVSVILLVVMMASMFAGCGEETAGPVEAKLRTDLNDAVFTMSYGDLRKVLPSDQLASLFETTKKKTDDKTVKISYYELVSKYSERDYFDALIALLSESDKNMISGNREQVLDYFNALINDIAASDSAAVKYHENFEIKFGDGVVFKDKNGNALPEQDILRSAFRVYADAALKNIDSFLKNSEEAESSREIIPVRDGKASLLTVNDLCGEYPAYSSVIPTYAYALDENGENAVDETGEQVLVPTELLRKIVITVKPTEESVKKAFFVRSKDGVMEELKKAGAYMTVNSYEVGFEPCIITASVNGVDDRMTSVEYEKNMIITADVTFTGALEKYGSVTVEFPCTSTLTYEFGWSE